MRRLLMCGVVLLMCGMPLQAQEKLSVKFRSRALFDATVSGYGQESVQGYYRVEDFRVGFKAVYGSYEVNTETPPQGYVSATGVTSLFATPMLEAEIPHMGTEVKGLVEVLYAAPRFMLQSGYFFNRLNRTGGRTAYCPHGGYVQGGFLIKGRGFDYDEMYGIPGRPCSAQAIEMVGRFNYTDLNHGPSQISGGSEKDFSLGINFYLNRYIGIKVNGSYVWLGEGCHDFYRKDFFLAQVRLQYIF